MKKNVAEKERDKIWENHMKIIKNEENVLDTSVNADIVEGPVVCVGREEVVLQVLNEVKSGKAHAPSDASMELIAASKELGIEVMSEVMSESKIDFECQLNLLYL